jgi:hypothetical protein
VALEALEIAAGQYGVLLEAVLLLHMLLLLLLLLLLVVGMSPHLLLQGDVLVWLAAVRQHDDRVRTRACDKKRHKSALDRGREH